MLPGFKPVLALVILAGVAFGGETGFLVPVQNAEAVAEKMCAFVENPERIKKMGQASAEYCRQKFDVRKVNADMCRYLKIKGNENFESV